jgi:hypothetical protein
MIRVVIESPYAGNVERNLDYLRAAMRDCLKRGEAPYASHALYTQPNVLVDTVPEERKLSMEAGFVWGEAAEKVVFYCDRGISRGMEEGLRRAQERGCPIELRSLGSEWAKP